MGAPADPQAPTGAPPMHTLDRRWLLVLYAVVPFALGVMLRDQLLLGGYLRQAVLPVAPDEWPAWTIVFGMPHVIAGLLTMADREYLGYYRRRLRWPLLGFGAISIAAATGPGQLAFGVALWLGLYTVTHLLTQQIGLSFTMLRKPPLGWMRLWKWTMLVLGVLMYAGLFLEMNLPDASLGGLDPHALVVRRGRTVAFWILPAVSVGLAYALQITTFPLFVAINFFLTFMHYHIESVVWRRPHLHRRFLVLS
jgi:hypothetical protein